MAILEFLGTIRLSSLPQLLVGLFLLLQGIVILIQNPLSALHRAFFMLQFPVFVWLTSMGLAYNAPTIEAALILTKIGFLGVLFIPIVAYTFSVYYTKQLNQKTLMYFGWGITFLIAVFTQHPLFVKGVMSYRFGYYIALGPASYLVIALFLCSIALFIKNLYAVYRAAEKVSRRWQLLTLVSGSLAFLATIDFLPAFGVSIPFTPPGYLFIGGLVTLMGYFIVRHRLSDISIILGRSIGYFLLTIILFLIYVSIFLALFPPEEDTRAFLMRAVFFIVILYGFAFLKEKNQSIIDRMFFKGKINFQREVNEFSANLRNLTQPKVLLATLFAFLTETLRIEKSVVLIFQRQEMRFMIYKNTDHAHPKPADARLSREFQTFFIEHPELIDIRDREEDSVPNQALSEADRLFAPYSWRAALPLTHYGTFLGFIIIGKHGLLKEYSRRETLALNHLSAPFSTAWENAKLYESIQNASKIKDDFVSISSHQLRTPITVIKWSLSLLQNIYHPSDPEAEDLLKTMNFSVEQMTSTINQLLEIARIEGEQKKIPLAPVGLAELLLELQKTFQPVMKHKRLSYSTELPSPVPLALGHKEHLTTALSIILDNAIKYTPIEGKITCKVEKRKDQKAVIIEISDTGIGIPKRACPQIFTKFFRAQNALSVRPNGSGLGLAYAKMLLERQNGEIWFNSEEGCGTTFFVSLPTAKTRRQKPL